MIIQAFNPPIDELEKSYLSKSVSDGATTLTVKNNQRFAGNDRILIGEMGSEGAEIRTVNSVSGNDKIIITGGALFSHPVDTPIYILRFDQIKFYRSTTGITGTYSILTTVDIDVDNADLMTPYDDTTGAATYYYKTSAYHSISTYESDKSDPVRGGGPTRKMVGKIMDNLLEEFGNPANDIISREMMLEWMNEVNDDLHTRTQRPYTFLHTRETLARSADSNSIDFPTDSDSVEKMWKFDRMEYNYVDTTTDPDTNETYTLRVISIEEFRQKYPDNTISSSIVSDQTQVIALDTAQRKFLYAPPSDTADSDAFILYYWKYFSVLDSEGDEIETPGSKIYKDYIRGKYYRRLAKRDSSYLTTSDRYFSDYNIEVGKLQRINRLDSGSPRSFGYRGGKDYRGYRRY